QIAVGVKAKFQKVQPKIDGMRQLCPYLKDWYNAAEPSVLAQMFAWIRSVKGEYKAK
mgnify:CR=1